MKILVAIPTFENISPEVFKAIYYLDNCEHTLRFDFVRGYDCANARNEIARQALIHKYDYVLMVDSDTIIPYDTLKHLLNPMTDIVLGFCPSKNTKGKHSTHWALNSKDTINYRDLKSNKRIELEKGGAACMLVNTDVFNNIAYPYFKAQMGENGIMDSEDYYFCENARSHGYKIWADPRVRCGHLVRYFQYE